MELVKLTVLLLCVVLILHITEGCTKLPMDPNGHFELDVVGNSTFGSIATLLCCNGYGSDSNTITCQANGEWGTPIPVCAPKECGPVPRIANGSFEPNFPQGVFGDVASQRCDVSFTSVTSKPTFIVCQANSAWSKTGECVQNCCGPPPSPTNGVVIGTQYLHDDVVTYHCNTGYALNAENTSTCQANGTWNHVNSTTCRADCGGLPPPPTNGNVTGSACLQSDEVTYSCKEGNVMYGENTTTCQSNGTWDNVGSICVCSILPQASTTANILFSHAGVVDSNYDNNIDCYWMIEAREGYTIYFSIKEMEIENVIGNDNCFDYVEVFDGQKDTTEKLGKYCGITVPAAISSTGQHLLVHFHSDDSVVYKGFEAEYKEGGQITN